jgi:hypothetical protein
MGRVDKAARAFASALQRQPEHPLALNNLGICMMEMRRFDEAIRAFQSAIQREPRRIDIWNNLGTAHRRLAREADAQACFESALRLDPSNVDALFGRALCMLESGRLEDSLDALDGVAQRDNCHWQARFHGALVRLMLGRWDEAWPHFALRQSQPDLADAVLRTTRPAWRPGESGGRVLVWAEQGIGDQILGASMLQQFRNLAPDLIVQVDSRLVGLLARSLPEIEFVSKDEAVDEQRYTSHLAMGDLGAWVRKSWQDFDAACAFLRADPHRSAALRAELGISADTRLYGLSWRSTREGRIGEDKSLPLDAFATLLKTPGAAFVNLQYGDTREEVQLLQQRHGVQLLHCRSVDNYADLDGLAALIQACDAVITVSNSTAHLAGGLGKRTELIAPPRGRALWYWCHTQNNHSLWYPSVRVNTIGVEIRSLPS